ncbi:hypothetical protein PO860_03300 [Rhizobium sp. BJ04]|uniref:hypothetical protein n=1 Tax=Rhizobium binxianense TaxID=3024242 RepID=UPI0023A9B6F8|nr:hypothetical protein [Rhizobium sp. BJ04]WEA60917.1 hypothetical protein PO860_03300 [Rhizobium sp. BJ04]
MAQSASNRSGESIAVANALSPSEGPGYGAANSAHLHRIKRRGATVGSDVDFLSVSDQETLDEFGFVQTLSDETYLKFVAGCHFLDFSPMGKIFSLHVPDDFLKFDRVVKCALQIQPDVKNSVIHTFAVRKRGGISVAADKRPDDIYIYVPERCEVDVQLLRSLTISILSMEYTTEPHPLNKLYVS